MKKLCFKNILKYTLVFCCALCAMFASVFVMQKSSVQAEERAIPPVEIQSADIVIDNNEAFYDLELYLRDDVVNLLREEPEHYLYNNGLHDWGDGKIIPDYDSMGYKAPIVLEGNYATAIVVCFAKEQTNYYDSAYDSYASSDNSYVYYYGSNKSFISGQDITKSNYNPNFYNYFTARVPANVVDTGNFYYWVEVVNIKIEETAHFTVCEEIYFETHVDTFHTSDNVYKSSLIELSSKEKAIEELTYRTDYLTNEEATTLLGVAGVNLSATDEVTLTVNYEKLINNKLSKTSESVLVQARYLFNIEELKSQFFNLSGKQYLSDFNVIQTYTYVNNSYTYETAERVYREAIDLIYDPLTNIDVNTKIATMTVNYDPFNASDFFIRLLNNDENNNYTLDLYTASIVDYETYKTITYDFTSMNSNMFSAFHFTVDFGAFDGEDALTTWTFSNASGDIQGVTYELTKNNLTITVNKNYEDNLKYLNVTCTAQIKEDEYYNAYCTYYEVDANYNIIERETMHFAYRYSMLLTWSMADNITKSDFYVDIAKGIENAKIDGVPFIRVTGVEVDWNPDGKESTLDCKFVVLYESDAILTVKGTNDYQTRRFVLNSNRLSYSFGEFFSESHLPSGYRVKSLEVEKGDITILQFDEYNPFDATIRIDGAVSDIPFNESSPVKQYVLNATLTNFWTVEVKMFKQYGSTPFATPYTVTKDILYKDLGYIPLGVLEYNDYKAFEPKLLSILGVNNLGLIQIQEIVPTTKPLYMSKVGAVDVTTSPAGKYIITCKYDAHTMAQIDSYGNFIKELKIPLSPFNEYSNYFGQDWSILMLNRDDGPRWFNYMSDVKKEELYGFFDIAVFENQSTNLNQIFSTYSTGGCRTVFKTKTISGSELYKFANLQAQSTWVNQTAGIILTWALEFLDTFDGDISNKTLYSYFFYLDGTNPDAFIALNGANDAEDDQTATEDKLDQILDGMQSNNNAFQDWWNNDPFAQTIKVFMWVIIGAVVLFVIYVLAKIARRI